MKEEFTTERLKEYDAESDVELIEDLYLAAPSIANNSYINAILNKRLKKSIQFLTEVIQKSSTTTEKYNKKLIVLTGAIVILTILMLIGLSVQIYLFLKTT